MANPKETRATAKNAKAIREYAKSLGARVTLPSDPGRPRNLFAKTDVSATWDLHRSKVAQADAPKVEQLRQRRK